MALTVWLLPLELESQAHLLAGLLAWVILWWICEPIPLPATALLGTCLSVVLGLTSAKSAFAPYSHPLIFLFMGGFFIAHAMALHGLDRRIALFVLTRKWIAGRPLPTVFALFGVTAFLSMWMSNTAATAMLLPICIGILGATLVRPEDHEKKGTVLISMAYAASIGGIATPVGSTPNIIAIGMLEKLGSMPLSFVEWMAYAFPTMLVCLLTLFIVTAKRLSRLPKRIETQYLFEEQRKLGPLSSGEKNTIFAAMVAVGLWITPSLLALALGKAHPVPVFLKSHFPEAVASILAACILFMLPVRGNPKINRALNWKEASKIDWGSLILFGGGISLGVLMFDTGLAKVVGSALVQSTGGGEYFWGFIAMSVFFAIFFTETTSNTATANMLIPLVIAASLESGFPVLIPTLGVTLACSLAFMMPVSTPPNAIVYGSGLIKISQMIRTGFVMNLLAGIIVMTSLFILQFFI